MDSYRIQIRCFSLIWTDIPLPKLPASAEMTVFIQSPHFTTPPQKSVSDILVHSDDTSAHRSHYDNRNSSEDHQHNPHTRR